MSIMHNRVFGFTLAEVLITLTIIGVVAALTIPALMQNINDAQNKVIAKRVYSNLEEVTRTIMMDNGGTMMGFATSHSSARDVYLAHMSAVKRCKNWVTSADGAYCGIDYCNYFTNNTGFGGDCNGTGGGFAVLSNGIFFLIIAGGGNGDPITCSPYCAQIVFDINGFKKPNQRDQDIFAVNVGADRLMPSSSLRELLKQ